VIGGWFPFPGGRLLGRRAAGQPADLARDAHQGRRARAAPRARRRDPRAGLALTWFVISHVFDLDSTTRTINPSQRVTIQLIQGGGAAAVLFVACWLLFQRKAGIVLLQPASSSSC
jgi:hypothetical protein